MSCTSPISWESLVAYWAADLTPADEARVEEHLMGCDSCTVESGRVSAIVEALRAFIPPVLSRANLGALKTRGLRIQENTFLPGQRQTVIFASGVDLLIHYLTGIDLSNARRVRVAGFVESTGERLFEDSNAPFDRNGGVLIACQRHFAILPHDTVFEVCTIDASGVETKARYTIPHIFED